VPSEKDFIFWPLAYQGFDVVEDFEAFQHHQVTDKQDDWHFEEMQYGGGRPRDK